MGANGKTMETRSYQDWRTCFEPKKVDLAEKCSAKYLKLEINDYQAGTMGWRSVGIQKFELILTFGPQ